MAGDFRGNNLLGALKQADLALLEPFLKSVTFQEGHTIYEPGDDVQHAYFPRGESLGCFLILMSDGEAVESALVGREGAMGGIVSNGHVPAFARCTVMHGGEFFRVPTNAIDEIKRRSTHMSHLFSRYADCLLAQVFQSAACNARHTIEQRAAKWLIAAVDRTGRDEISLTQSQLASLLGVGRTYVSRIVARMKAKGIIETHRGGIRIIDRALLENNSCNCSQLVAEHFEIVLKGIYPVGD
jgi:CRP-like cAMP-binding protein